MRLHGRLAEVQALRDGAVAEAVGDELEHLALPWAQDGSRRRLRPGGTGDEQAALFAWGAIAGVQTTIHAKVFKALIRPRLAAPDHLEDPAPPRFAQAVGLAFTAVALVAFLAGGTAVGMVAIAFALVAATLNAVFRFCLGCELYLLLKRFA